jgi:hypothetical protein
LPVDRKPQNRHGAAFGATRQIQRAAVSLEDTFGQRQAEAEPRALRGFEGLEELRRVAPRDAAPCVGHPQLDEGAIGGAGAPDGEIAAIGHCLQAVRDDAVDCLGERGTLARTLGKPSDIRATMLTFLSLACASKLRKQPVAMTPRSIRSTVSVPRIEYCSSWRTDPSSRSA